ncbi:MAG: hypothetical protein Q8M83_06135 [bacterium]|nr:hypothetical protein [bacterium]
MGETLIQHLGERDFFGRATAGGFQKFLILLTIVQGVFLIVKGAYKYFEEYLKTKYKICCFLKFKWVDYLILLFSSGILNPKIY